MTNEREDTSQALEILSQNSVDMNRLETIKTMFSSTSAVFGAISEVGHSAHEIARCARDMVQLKYEFEMTLKMLDHQHASRIQQLHSYGPTIKKELEKLSDRLDKVLDAALCINTTTATTQDLHHRAQLLDLVDRFSSQLTLVLVKFVSL